MVELNSIYRHRKTGNRYLTQMFVRNQTNAQENQKMVAYIALATTLHKPDTFVREVEEFKEKFELI